MPRHSRTMQIRLVTVTDSGQWAVRLPGVARASKLCPDRTDAVAWARRSVAIAGGGEVEVELVDGTHQVISVRPRTGGPRPNLLLGSRRR